MKKLIIQIGMCNADILEGQERAIARILRELALRYEEGTELAGRTLRDVNGNTVGCTYFEGRED